MADQAYTYIHVYQTSAYMMHVTKQRQAASDKKQLLCALPTTAYIAPHTKCICGIVHSFARHSRNLLVKQLRRLRLGPPLGAVQRHQANSSCPPRHAGVHLDRRTKLQVCHRHVQAAAKDAVQSHTSRILVLRISCDFVPKVMPA